MKKYIILISLVLVTFFASAQSRSLREKGLVFRPEVGLGTYSVGTFENICGINSFAKASLGTTMYNHNIFLKNKGDSGISYNFLANYGMLVARWIYIGVGTGFYGNNGGVSVPFYVNPRIYLGNRRTTFYFDFRAGYAFSLFGNKLDDDSYYIKRGVFDKAIYYYNSTTDEFIETLDYTNFVTVKSSALRMKGYYFSFGLGFESGRSSYTFSIDVFNTNLKTTVENHYWEYANSGESVKDAPTKYNTETNTYDDANKRGWVLSFKYGYSLYK